MIRLPSWWPGARHRTWEHANRWIVLDVETTGLDTRSCRLLAVAALALHRDGPTLRIQARDSFEVGVRQADDAPVDKHNILLHHIGVAEQKSGVGSATALHDFEAWIDSAPLLGYHVHFDRDVLQRVGRQACGHALAGPWIDISPLASICHPEARARALDEWLDHFDIDCADRHQAAADVWATAELMLRLWPALQLQGADSPKAMMQLIEQRRWLERQAR